MIQYWPALVFGWPAVIATFALCVAGIVRKRSGFLLAAAIIVLPFSAYLAATPRFRWIGLLIPLSIAIAALAIKRDRVVIAWIFLVPFVAISSWVALAVINE